MSVRVGQRFMARSAVFRPVAYDAYRRSHEIEGSTVGAQTDYQVKVRALYDYSFPDGRFYDLSDEWVATVADPNDTHYMFPAHKTNIVEVNKVVDGVSRKYLAYDCDITASAATRLFYTDDLDGVWTPFSGNPILGPNPSHYRKPSVAYDAGTFHMFIADFTDKKLERWTSADGITFGFVENITVPVETVWMAPFIWFNPNDNRWYLYHSEWNAVDALCKQYVRSAATIAGLSGAACSQLIGVPVYYTVISVMYRDGLYWLVVEDEVGGIWKTFAYWGNSPVSFTECTDSPILVNEDACAQMGLSPDGSKAYMFYNRFGGGAIWHQKVREIYATSLRKHEVDLNGNCRADFGDVRFRQGETELDYWMEGKVDSDYADFWVEIPTIPIDPGTTTIHIYYGRADMATISDGDDTFPLFDHFLGAIVDGAKWNTHTAIAGTVGVAGSILTCSFPNSNWSQAEVRSKAPYLYGDNYAVRARASSLTSARRNTFIGFSNYDDAVYPVVLSSEQGLLIVWSDPAKYVRTAHLDVLTNTAMIFTLDAYRVFETRRTAANFVGLEEDAYVPPTENTTNLPGGSISVVLGIEGPNLGTAGSILVDWALVRKYVDPEPANGDWGSEEAVMWPF